GAEERGQAEAIAYNLREMFKLKTRTMSIVLGEGGSGGALGIGVTDKIFMLQYATYSVISPEGCASILFRDAKKADISAKALKQTSSDLMGFGIIDGIIPEPLGGAHNDPSEIYSTLKSVIIDEFNKLKKRSVNVLMKKRLNKYRSIGVYSE
ncbi:acetyl-CoA carboxylase carboxyl transferase subunit alpha, partial [Candidatus Calescamantes bacterium]|nr:acetyl-CoA carboxylase carboxyl transferase subunit alpha [Candidatus Calescamantes bacterium]